MYAIGLYKTRKEAEKAAIMWAEVFDEQRIVIELVGSHYQVLVPVEE